MYKIIGADGKEYGPVTGEQIRQWIAEGRVNSQTKILAEGTTEWKTAADFPEFMMKAAGASPPPPPLSAAPPSGSADISKVDGPAIGLMVVGGLNLVLAALSLIMHLTGAAFFNARQMPEGWAQMFTGPLSLISNGVSLLISFVIFFGGLKMKQLQSHGLAVTASVLAIIPCTSPCCLLGIPIGVWALIVLMKPEIKNAFH